MRYRENTHLPGNQRIFLSRYVGQCIKTIEMDDPAQSYSILSPLSFMRCLDKLCSVSIFTIATRMEQGPSAECFEPLRLHMSTFGLEFLERSCDANIKRCLQGDRFLKGYEHLTAECKW